MICQHISFKIVDFVHRPRYNQAMRKPPLALLMLCLSLSLLNCGGGSTGPEPFSLYGTWFCGAEWSANGHKGYQKLMFMPRSDSATAAGDTLGNGTFLSEFVDTTALRLGVTGPAITHYGWIQISGNVLKLNATKTRNGATSITWNAEALLDVCSFSSNDAGQLRLSENGPDYFLQFGVQTYTFTKSQ